MSGPHLTLVALILCVALWAGLAMLRNAAVVGMAAMKRSVLDHHRAVTEQTGRPPPPFWWDPHANRPVPLPPDIVRERTEAGFTVREVPADAVPEVPMPWWAHGVVLTRVPPWLFHGAFALATVLLAVLAVRNRTG